MRLFESSGAPRWSSAKSLPYDAHGSGQGTLTFALADDVTTSERIARWGIAAFYKGHGEFSYQRTRFIHKRMSLLHWCNGWMVRGLAALALARVRQAGEVRTESVGSARRSRASGDDASRRSCRTVVARAP